MNSSSNGFADLHLLGDCAMRPSVPLSARHPAGVGYLTVPNRWMLTEPHYRLKFLSWWPRGLRTPYLRLMRKGTFYDCEPLQLAQLEGMLAAAGCRYCNLCVEALRETFEIEHAGALTVPTMSSPSTALPTAPNASTGPRSASRTDLSGCPTSEAGRHSRAWTCRRPHGTASRA